MISIGIRELRQRASRYLELVRGGNTIQVTDRGRPVALLVPIPQGSEVDRLSAEGRLSSDRGDLLSLGPPLPQAPAEVAASVVLEKMRADER
jgi:prevent-host-death family protein